jgi:hypothetical protein
VQNKAALVEYASELHNPAAEESVSACRCRTNI